MNCPQWVSMFLRRTPSPVLSRYACPSQCNASVGPKSTENPAPSCPRRKSLDSSLLLLMVNPLHPDPTALQPLPVPPHGLAEVFWPQRSPPVIGFVIPSPGSCFTIWIGGRVGGGRGCREVGLLLVHALNPLALHPSCALDDVADEDLCHRAHANDDVLGHGLGDCRVDQLSERLDRAARRGRSPTEAGRLLTLLTDALLRLAARQFSNR